MWEILPSRCEMHTKSTLLSLCLSLGLQWIKIMMSHSVYLLNQKMRLLNLPRFWFFEVLDLSRSSRRLLSYHSKSLLLFFADFKHGHDYQDDLQNISWMHFQSLHLDSTVRVFPRRQNVTNSLQIHGEKQSHLIVFENECYSFLFMLLIERHFARLASHLYQLL